MAIFTAARAQAGVPTRLQEKGVFTEVSGCTLSANPTADIVLMVKVPAGATVLAVDLVNAALGGSTTGSVGDTASATYWINAQSTVAVARTRSTALTKTYTADDTIKYTVSAGPATGIVQLVVLMTMETTVVA